jgi:HEAT repeat protein
MQCRGLTDARRRCENAADPVTGYCAEHRDTVARLTGRSPNGNGDGKLGALMNRLGLDLTRPTIPDGARYDVPGWLWNSATPEVVERLLNDDDSMVRWMAGFTLRKRRAVEAIEPLWRALKSDPVRLVRQQAAVALGKIGTPAVYAALVEGLYHDGDMGVRQACAVALGNLGYRAAAPELVRALEEEESAFVRWDIIVALGQLGDRRVEPLLAQLENEEIAEVVRRACRDARLELGRG